MNAHFLLILLTGIYSPLYCYYKANSVSKVTLKQCPPDTNSVCLLVRSTTNATIYSLGCSSYEMCPSPSLCRLVEGGINLCCCYSDGCNNVSFNDSGKRGPIMVPKTVKPPVIESLNSPTFSLWIGVVVILGCVISVFLYSVRSFIINRNVDRLNDRNLTQRAMKVPPIHRKLLWSTSSKMLSKGIFGGSWAFFKSAKSSHLINELRIYDIFARDELFLSPNVVRLVDLFYMEDQIYPFSLAFEYFPQGSVFDLVSQNSVRYNYEQLLHLVWSFVNGLAYLHERRNGKPAIAHRNINSTKVLVSRDLYSAHICDLSQAVAFDGCEDPRIRTQVGDVRYMAPELLMGVVGSSPSSYLAIDMYAFSLVVWEMLSNAGGLDYSPPYSKYECTLENMRNVVGRLKDRPLMLIEWTISDDLRIICELITACWEPDASARLTANCVSQLLSRNV